MKKPNFDFGRPSLSRRNLLKGLGVGALGAGAGLYGTARAHNQASAPVPGILGLERTQVGEFEITVIKDTALELPSSALAGNAPEGAVAELLGRYNLPTETVTASVNVLLLRSGDELTLIDAGNGGNLLGTLEAISVAPADISHVVLTHWHGDHITGVSTDGALNFPNAAHYFPRLDWEFLGANAASDEGIQGSLTTLTPADEAGVLTLYDGDGEIIPGLTGVPAYGHTPGHHGLLLGSGDTQLMMMADTANHPLVSLSRPKWAFGFDGDAAQATETRRTLYGRAADEGLRVFAYHFGFPGFGYVTREGEGFRFTATL